MTWPRCSPPDPCKTLKKGWIRDEGEYCAGLYETSDGHKLDIREESNHLYYYAFGKDELLPISQLRFITSAEVKFFTFVKNPNSEVTEILYEIGDMEIRAKKIK